MGVSLSASVVKTLALQRTTAFCLSGFLHAQELSCRYLSSAFSPAHHAHMQVIEPWSLQNSQGQTGSTGWGSKPQAPCGSCLSTLCRGMAAIPCCLLCSGSFRVTDGSICGIAAASPASPALILAQQCPTIPLIHKTLGFLLFPLLPWDTFFQRYWFRLINTETILWKITGGMGLGATRQMRFFFSHQIFPKLCTNCVLQLMMKC